MSQQDQVAADGSAYVPVHFLFDRGGGAWRIACVPNMVEFSAGTNRGHPWQRTGEPGAVTCAACKKTEVFAATRAAHEAITRGAKK